MWAASSHRVGWWGTGRCWLLELQRRTTLAIEWCNPLAAATGRTRGPTDELGQGVHHNVGTQPAAVRGQQGQHSYPHWRW